MKTPIDFSGLVDLFNPKTEAEGATLLAKTRSLDSDARYNDARTGLIGDRRNALSNEGKLLAAGYTPRQILAMQTAQSDSVADIMAGRRTDMGTTLLTEGGDPRRAGILLNFTKAGDADFAPTDERADFLRQQDASNELARVIANATVRSAVDPNATATLGQGATLVRKNDGSVVASGTPATATLAQGATLVNKNDGSVVATGSEKPVDPLKAAQTQKAINDLIIAGIGGIKDRKTGTVMGENNGSLMPLDSSQIARIQARVKELNPAPDQIEAAVQQAAAELGIDLNSKENVRGPANLFNWMGPVKGVRFKESVAAAKPAAKAAPAVPDINPVKITTKEERDALAPGTVYVAPDGVVRTKK